MLTQNEIPALALQVAKKHSYDKCCQSLERQKVLRYFDVLDLDETGTVRDRINRAEKKGVIENAETFIQIRLLRREIAHEYKPDAIFAIFESVLELTPILLKCIESIIAYSARYKDM